MRSEGAAKKLADVYRVKIKKMDKFVLSEAEWNRVFYASAPIGCRGFFYGGNYVKSD